MQHKSGKEYDPSAWAAQRRAAVEAANVKRLERKVGSNEATEHSFTPELIARKGSNQPGNSPSLPVEMDQHHHGSMQQGRQQPLRPSPYRQQQLFGGADGASLDQIASDSLDHFYASEGARLQGVVIEGSGLTPGKENHHVMGGRSRPGAFPGDSLGDELRRQTNAGGTSPYLSKFGQELYQEGVASGAPWTHTLLASHARRFPAMVTEKQKALDTSITSSAPSQRRSTSAGQRPFNKETEH